MMDADTQLIDCSPGPSHSGDSSDSEESSGSDTPSNQPTQLLYTQLLDSYDRYGEDMDEAGRTQQLDAMDMATQLIEDDSYDDFREHKGMGDDCTMIIPSEDEASKDTQLVNAEDGYTGTSSEKDDEVDSGLSPYGAAFKEKSSHWFAEIAGKRKAENVSTCIFGEGSAGLKHGIYGDRRGDPGSESDKKHFKLGNPGAGVWSSAEMQSRDSDIPHFLKDPDFSKQIIGSHRMVGSWHEVVGDRSRCNEDQRVWESAMGGLQIVDSDGNTEDEREGEGDNERHFNTSSTYPGDGNSSQNVSGRLSAYSSGNFCQQDLNKSPEPEPLLMDDDWGGVNGEDLGIIGRIDEGGSNVGLLDRHEMTCPSQSTPSRSRSCEGVQPAERRSLHTNSRTSGSIRTASLRASALRASSCSGSARNRHTPRGSQSEEVQNLEREVTDAPTVEVSWKTPKSAGFITPTSRLSIQKGALSSAASGASVWSNSGKAGEYPGSAEIGLVPEHVKDQPAGESSAEKHGCIGTSASGLGGSKTGEKNLNRARKLFSGNEVDQDDVFSQVKEQEQHKSPSPAKEVGTSREKVEGMLPAIIDSQADKRLERRSSFGSGVFSVGSELSYLNFQSPGEDSQARALNMVDKLVWLNATGLSQEPLLEVEKAPARGPSTAKSALQSRVQVAEAKAGMNDPLGVFDWVDSQHDEAGIFFGGKGANALKGATKHAVAPGHPKQVGFGTRKAGVLDASGLRNKNSEKLPEKPFKAAANTERPKGLSKNILCSKDNKNEPHIRLGKDSTSSAGLLSNLREPGRVQTAPSLDKPRQTIGNKGLQGSRVGKNIEGSTTTPAVDNSRPEVTSNAALQRSKAWSGGQGPDGLPKSTGLQEAKHVSRTSEPPMKIPDVQKSCGESIADKQGDEPSRVISGKEASNLPQSPRKAIQKDNSLPPVESAMDSRPEGLLEVVASSKNEKAEAKLASCVPILTHPSKGDDARSDARLTASTDISFPNSSKAHLLQEDGRWPGTTADLPDAPVPHSPRMPRDRGGQARSSEILRQPLKHGNAVGEDRLGGARVEPENEDGKNFQSLEFNGVQDNDCMDCDVDESAGAPGSVSSTFLSPEKEAEENAEVVSVRQINMGPDTLGAVEAMEMLSSDFLAENGEGSDEPAGEKEPSSLPGSDDDKTPGFVPEVNGGVEGRRVVTRRSRTHGRQNAGAEATGPLKGYQHSKMRARNVRAENRDPSSEKTNILKDRPRSRRVSWAGPLEQVPRRPVEARRGRRARQQQNACREEEDEDNSRPSSDQDEVEDMKDAANGDWKRKAEGDIAPSKDSDLDKIKKRFNMSDAAVARLLGTDEDEEPEISRSPGVKTRSLSHMQPEAEEDEAAGPPKIRKASKGLRSSRSRGEDGSINGRRKRACATPSDQERQGGEERIGSPCDTDAAETSVERTACVETHPSDNEAHPGRTRMRSIADVTCPSVKKTLPGGPPQGTSLRRGRGRRHFRAPSEQKADPSDVEQVDVPPPPIPPAFPPVSGRLRGKGGPRSARKRKELEPLTMDVSTTSATSSKEASPSSSKEASKRRKGEALTVCVLFSHGLPEDVGKQQRKIVSRLGGKITSSAAESTHFVAEKFVRTGNMLEAMAAGKPVVTAAWLDTCLESKCFVNEEPYILQDSKKETEMGFSMVSTLHEAQQRPLLQGIRVYITPGTSPGPDALARIVKAAGGQVVDEYVGPAPDGERDSDYCLVLSSEDEFELCSPFLDQGAKVFTPELLLSGVMCHNLDFSNDQLFQNFSNRRRRASLSRKTTV